MVADLQQTKGNEKCMGDSFVGRLTSEFEAHMNNDLDVKDAFDSLYRTVTEIHQKSATLTDEEIKNVLADLRRIDGVLECIF
jgi:cysteinyl-tRNA synthetase